MTKVLIVEDNNTLRTAYEIILTKEGFKVSLAVSGEEGLKAAASDEPDLILLDMLMPVSNGLDFLRRYDAPKLHPNVKIVVFSNITEQAITSEAVGLGATQYVTKASVSPKELVELIHQVLGSTTSENTEVK